MKRFAAQLSDLCVLCVNLRKGKPIVATPASAWTNELIGVDTSGFACTIAAMTKKLLIPSILVLSVGLFGLADCKKKGPDLSKFNEICETLQKCDKNPQMKMLYMQPDSCQKMFAGMEKQPQFAATSAQLTDCITKTPCDKLDSMKCFAASAQGIMPMMPAPNK